MSDFDPNDELTTQEKADAYVNWCAENFMRLSGAGPFTYRTAIRCSAWLLVVATAQMHLDDEWPHNREELVHQLTMNTALARSMERQKRRFAVERLIVMRSGLDCWRPVGRYAEHLLCAAACALAARILIEVHPLVDLYDVECPDVWSLLMMGGVKLGDINQGEGQIELEDYALQPNEDVVAKFQWQKLEGITRHMGIPPLSPN